MGGYMGKVLRVDLSTGDIAQGEIDKGVLDNFVGGTGLGIKILYEEVPKGVNPYDPENRLVFATGPLNGTAAPGSGTYSVISKGPLTELAVCSQANGHFGAKLKFAGYDAVILHGNSDKWVYLTLLDDRAEIRDASHLLGQDTIETEDILKRELNASKASIACIGPAGEKLVKFAAIFSDKGHVASSGGLGAVMGAKKLKAIVVGGGKKVPVKDGDSLREIVKQWIPQAKASPLGALVDAYGTAGYYSAAHEAGWLPVKNLTTSVFPEHNKFNGDHIRSLYELKRNPCHACPLNHCHTLKITQGPYAGLETEEPEYEDLAAFSSNIGNTDPDAAVKLSDLNDRLGMDVKEVGFTLSFALECYEKGLLTKADTGGLELSWGNIPVIIKLLGMIARREGLGNVLAEGVCRAAKQIGKGAENLAVHSAKGNAPHIHDPRGMWSILFGQAVSDMGSFEGSILEFLPDADIGFAEPIPGFSVDIVPKALAKSSPRRQFEDSLVICWFLLSGVPMDTILGALNAVTGADFTRERAFLTGERIVTLLRLFNLRHGLTPQADKISPRLAQAPITGPAKGISIAPDYEQMLKRYYREMGWDENSGCPLPKTLERLGLYG